MTMRITDIAIKHHISRVSVYRWLKRYDGTVESLYEKSNRPHSHPRQHTLEEIKLIKKVWSHNKQLGLVCLHMMDGERFYSNRKFYSVKDANEQLQRYQRWDNNFPLLVLSRKSPISFWKKNFAKV